MSILIGELCTLTEGLTKRLEDLEISERLEIIQTIALLRSARKLRRVQDTWEDLLSLKLQWKPSPDAGVKNSKVV